MSKFKKDSGNLTKTDMARVIVQALFNMDSLPPADNINVKRRARATKSHLTENHKTAVAILQKRGSA